MELKNVDGKVYTLWERMEFRPFWIIVGLKQRRGIEVVRSAIGATTYQLKYVNHAFLVLIQ